MKELHALSVRLEVSFAVPSRLRPFKKTKTVVTFRIQVDSFEHLDSTEDQNFWLYT
jgi:hypothetical protein